MRPTSAALRTVGDVAAWLSETAAASEFDLLGTDPVCQVIVRYVGLLVVPDQSSPEAPLACYFDGDGLVLCLGEGFRVPVPVRSNGPALAADGSLETFGASEIYPGVWALEPSLNLPGLIHGFVVIVDMPLAPWRRGAVLLAEGR